MNRQGRSPGNLTRFEPRGQVSVKPGFAVESNAGVYRGLRGALNTLTGSLSQLAARTLKRQTREAVEAGKAAGYSVDLGLSDKQTTVNGADGAVPVRSGSLLDRIIGVESGGNPTAKNSKSSATGLGQFIEGTWLETIGRHRPDLVQGRSRADILKLRNDPAISREMANHYIDEVKTNLTNAGHEATDGNVYLGYFLGPGGANAVLGADPNRSVADVLTEAVGQRAAGQMVKANGAILKGRTAGDVRAWAARKVGRPAKTSGTGRPSGSGPALALRSGGDPVLSDAYNSAFQRSVARRLPLETDEALEAAYDAHNDDPAQMRAVFDELEENTLSRVGEDPELQHQVRAVFRAKRKLYERSADAAEDARVRDGELSDYRDVLETSTKALERQAYLAADDEEAVQALTVSSNERLSAIDDALEAGVIDETTAQKHRREILHTVTVGRLQGVFDSLPGPDEKETFVDELRQDWANGEPVLSDLDLEQVRSLERRFDATVKTERREAVEANALDQAALQRMVTDDLTSIRQTGVPLQTDGDELTDAQIRSALGDQAAADWQRQRDLNQRLFEATDGLIAASAREIERRLLALEPEPGSAGFAENTSLLAEAQRHANDVFKQRRDDPASSVDQAFPRLRSLKEAALAGGPAELEQLLATRLDAQSSLGIPNRAQAPLTVSEALTLAEEAPLEPDRAQWRAFAQTLDERYGPYADEVMAQVLRGRGIHRDLSHMATALMKKIDIGQEPSRLDQQAFEKAADEIQANEAFDPSAKEAAGDLQSLQQLYGLADWADERPTSAAVNALIANPGKADQFDKMFGDGTARYFIEQSAVRQRRLQREDNQLTRQGVTLNPDGSEDYDPAFDVAPRVAPDKTPEARPSASDPRSGIRPGPRIGPSG